MQKVIGCVVQAHDVFSLQKTGGKGVAVTPEVKMVEEMLATGVIEESNSPGI